MALDTLRTVEAPEGVRLSLRAAGPVARFLAWSIDGSIRGFAYMGLAMALVSAFAEMGGALLVLLLFAGEWGYPVLFEVLRDGQTPGKQVVGLRVVNDDGTPVDWTRSILRNLLLAADFLPGTCLAGLVSMLVSRDFRRLGDLAAGTLVVHVEPKDAPSGVPPEAVPLPPPIRLELDEQRAVIAFAENAALLSEARAAELAGLAAPLLGPKGSPREQLIGMGAWLLGRRGGAAG
jgi:uncharacterized RDD family membrane protein YckC